MLTDAQKFWNAISGKVRDLCRIETRNTFRCERYDVTTAPNGSVIGVRRPFGGTEIFVPYSNEVASATVGDTVLVVWWGSMSNAKAYYFSNGYAGSAGGSGHGIPAGGETGQVLKKASDADYDAEWGYPESRSYELIWTNPNPTSAFAAQTVALDLSDSPAVMVEFALSAGSSLVAARTFWQGHGVYLDYLPWPNSTTVNLAGRTIEVTSSGVVFGSGLAMAQGSAQTNINNRYVPLRIYALRSGSISPTITGASVGYADFTRASSGAAINANVTVNGLTASNSAILAVLGYYNGKYYSTPTANPSEWGSIAFQQQAYTDTNLVHLTVAQGSATAFTAFRVVYVRFGS